MIEPTEKMIKAGVEFALGASVHGAGGWPEYIKGLYSAMAAADADELTTLREKARMYDEARGQEPSTYRYRVRTDYGEAITFYPEDRKVLESMPLYTKPVPQEIAVPDTRSLLDDDAFIERVFDTARRSYRHDKAQCKGQIVTKADDPNWHIVCAAIGEFLLLLEPK